MWCTRVYLYLCVSLVYLSSAVVYLRVTVVYLSLPVPWCICNVSEEYLCLGKVGRLQAPIAIYLYEAVVLESFLCYV